MTQIFKYKGDLDTAALKEIERKKILGLDSEAEGLKIPHFHKMSLIQIFDGDKVYIIQPNRENYSCPNIVKILENEKIEKVFHYARFDCCALEFFLKTEVKNLFCTKISSKLIRGYSQSHGLKDLVFEFCGQKKLDKRFGSSDWNKNLDALSEAQLQYAANDTIYLIQIRNQLYDMMKREKKLDIYNNLIFGLKTRIKLDQMGISEDLYQH
jgi:ribonuclease D